MSADRLPRYLLQLIQSGHYGGRTLRTDESTVVLYDCGLWSDAHSRCVRDRFPECEIFVQPSQGSLSGFIVVFKMRSDRLTYVWASLTAAVLVGMALTARQVLL